MRPGDPATAETARSYFENSFFSGRRYDLSRVGRHKLNRKLGPEFDFLEETFGLDFERPRPGAVPACRRARCWPRPPTC